MQYKESQLLSNKRKYKPFYNHSQFFFRVQNSS